MWSSLKKQAAQIQSLTQDRLQQVTAHARELAKEVMTEEQEPEQQQQQDRDIEDELIHALTHAARSPLPPLPLSASSHPLPHVSPVAMALPNGRVHHSNEHFSYSAALSTSHVSIPQHDDGEEKEVEIVDNGHAHAHAAASTLREPPLASPSLFSPASTSPTSVPPHSLRDSSPTSFFSTVPTHSPVSLSAVPGSEERRLRAEVEERETELSAYREEPAVVKQQLRGAQDGHEQIVLEYQHIVRSQQEDIERLHRETRERTTTGTPLLSSQPAPHSLQRSSSFHQDITSTLSPPIAPQALVDVLHHSQELGTLQRTLEDAESAHREECEALERITADVRSEKERLVHDHTVALHAAEDEHERALLGMQEQLRSLKAQLRESTERGAVLETQLDAAKSASAVHFHDDNGDDGAEERVRRIRSEYESEIEGLRRELMVTSAKLSHSTTSSALALPASSTSSPSATTSALQAQLSALQASHSESALLVSSLRESNAKLTAELKAAVSVRDKMVAWRGEVQAVMSKWKKEREEREARVKDLKKRVKAAEKEREDVALQRDSERRLWQEAELRARKDAEAREQEREVAMQEERAEYGRRIHELEMEARRLWEEHAREREHVDSVAKSTVERLELDKSRLREDTLAAEKDRELAERDCAELEKAVTALRSERDEALVTIEQLRAQTTALPEDSPRNGHVDHGGDVDAERASLLQRLTEQIAVAQEAKQALTGMKSVVDELQERARLQAEEDLRLRANLRESAEQLQAATARIEELTAQLSAVPAQSSTAASATASAPAASGSDTKVRELQSHLKQARDAYEALSKRFAEVQSECRQLMKKEEQTNALIARLTGEVQRLKSTGDDVNEQLSEQALQERVQQLTYDMEAKTKESDEWERKYRAAAAEQHATRQQQADATGKARAGGDDRDEEIRSLRHQLQQLALDASAMDSLAQDLSTLQRESLQWSKEKATMTREIERLMSMLSAENDSRDRDWQQRERELEQLRAKAEAAQHEHEQVEHLSHELALLNTNLQHVREQLVHSQRQVRALTDDNSALKKAMDDTIARLQRFNANDDAQSVDRRLVVKMLVTFFERGQRQEVLDLMYRILQFPEEDRRKVDASRGVTGAGGLGGRLLSFASMLSPFDAEKARVPAAVDESSLADLWVDFLLKESTKDDAANKPRLGSGKIYEAMGSPAPAPSSSLPAPAFSTPQPTQQRQFSAPLPPPASSSFSTPQPHPSSHAPAAAAVPHTVVAGRPPLPLSAVPITLPPHLRPPFPVSSSRHTPLPAFNLPNHPVLHAALPRMAVPGMPVSAGALRPPSPRAAAVSVPGTATASVNGIAAPTEPLSVGRGGT